MHAPPPMSSSSKIVYHPSRIFLSPFTGLQFTPLKGTPNYRNSSLIIPIAMVYPKASKNRETVPIPSHQSFALLLVAYIYFFSSLFQHSNFQIIPEHPFFMLDGGTYLQLIAPKEPTPIPFIVSETTTTPTNLLLDLLPHIILKIEYVSLPLIAFLLLLFLSFLHFCSGQLIL